MIENQLDEIVVGNRVYAICRMNAEDGSWLLMQLMGKIVKISSDISQSQQQPKPTPDAPETNPLEAANAAIQYMLMNIDKETFSQVQRYALGCVFEVKNGMPLAVVDWKGKIADKELRFDIKTIQELTSKSLSVNISPFFSKDALVETITGNKKS